jgi:uncharacterized protein
MYEKGLGTDKDPAKALQLYRSAAEHGYAEAQNLMGILYATGTGGVAQDDKQAVDWYQKAADQNFAKAEKNLGDMYFFGHGVERDYKQAMTWYGKASGQNVRLRGGSGLPACDRARASRCGGFPARRRRPLRAPP